MAGSHPDTDRVAKGPRIVNPPLRSLASRRLILTGTLAAGTSAVLAACSDSDDATQKKAAKGGKGTGTRFAATAAANTVVDPADDAAAAAAVSAAVVETAEHVAVADPGSADALSTIADLAAKAHIPLLLGTGAATADELTRLKTTTVIHPKGLDITGLGEKLKSVELDLAADPATDMPTTTVGQKAAPLLLLVDPTEKETPGRTAAVATVRAAGGTVAEVPGSDPRATGDTIQAVKPHAQKDPSAGVIALGAAFGDAATLTERVTATADVPELPGGGQVVFPHRRMIAPYGSPGTPSLGVLGEGTVDEAIALAKQYAKDYQPHSDVPVQPAFEIITTIASSAAGADGDYSAEIDPETIRPWVEAAGKEGIYVVLDLQPGRTDFLTQAKLYEDLLKHPHVGLALDPEWRLKPDQKHMRQIGSVEAAEINTVITWLADLVKSNRLPQKVLILHQFQLAMIRSRQDVDTSREELAITLHADGHGVRSEKMATWDALRTDLPEGIWMAWKNFIDEDKPMFTPEETYAIEPRPWFVSYQ